VFDIGCAVAPNMATLIVLRFFAAAVGSSSFTNAGGVVADIWPVEQRGMGLLAFSAAPFFGPVLGPVCSGFLGESKGWRWVEGLVYVRIYRVKSCV
jgi:MFS family permease